MSAKSARWMLTYRETYRELTVGYHELTVGCRKRVP
jgi:hypothetical protein